MATTSVLVALNVLKATAGEVTVRRGMRHMQRRPRTIARERRQGQLLQTPEWLGDGLKFDDNNRLDFDLDNVFPVVDTNNIVKDPDDATKTMRIDVGAVATGATRVLTMPNQDVDFSALVVGTGLATADGTLHVHTGSAGTVTAESSSADLVVESNAAGGISILTPNNVSGTIAFGDPENNEIGTIEYNHSVNTLTLSASGTEVVMSSSNKTISLNNADYLLTNYTNSSRPAAGVAGRTIFNTDDGQLNIDDGTNWTLPDGTTT